MRETPPDRVWLKLRRRLVVTALIAAVLLYKIVFWHAISLEFLQAHRAEWQVYHSSHPWLAVFIFASIYIFLTSISFPGATVLTLLGGCLFGLVVGTVVCLLASTIGATIAFLLARWIFRNILEERYREKLKTLREGVARNEITYLLSLRLNPIMPFWLINLLMGLTSIRTLRYFWVSQLGIIPGAILYVNAGTKLAHLKSIRDVLTPSVLSAFMLLAAFPVVVRLIMSYAARRFPRRLDSSDTSRM